MNIVKTYIPCFAAFGVGGGLDPKPAMELMAVLTQDAAGLYACYVGLVPAHERGLSAMDRDTLKQLNATAVARNGNKLPHREVFVYFRGIKEEEYRR